MFVLSSTHEKLKKENKEYKKLVDYWKACFYELSNQIGLYKSELRLVERQKEILEQLLSEKESQGSSVFTEDEIRTLISLCHPDKHGGKESANRITQKLIQIRNKEK